MTNLTHLSEEEQTKIFFFGLGKADSIYIEHGSYSLLIDTGLKKQGQMILSKLQGLGVKRLDYLILTHPDKDHIGSAAYLLEHLEVGELIQSIHSKGKPREQHLKEVIESRQINHNQLTEDRKINLGRLEITLITPKKTTYKKSNNYSIITLIKDESLVYLFAGDAEKKLLKELLTRKLPKVTLYKVPHHGKQNKKSKLFIETIKPTYAVITNHNIEAEIEVDLKASNSEVFYTADEDIIVVSDGHKLTFR